MLSEKQWQVLTAKRRLLHERVVNILTKEELIALTAVSTYSPSHALVREMQEAVQDELGGPIEHGLAEFRDWEIYGWEYERGYIITSQEVSASAVETVSHEA